jgi:hypothetical protein
MASFVLINPVAYLDAYALQAEMRALGLQLGTATKDNTSAASGGSQLGQPGLKDRGGVAEGVHVVRRVAGRHRETLFNRQRTTDIPYMVSPAGGPVGDVAFS